CCCESRGRHTRLVSDWSSDVCSSDLVLGRLDVKIKIERPDAEAAKDIFSKYILAGLPLHPDDLAEHGGDPDACVAAMIQAAVLKIGRASCRERAEEWAGGRGCRTVVR